MRFLADENFPGDAVTALRTLGHDVLWIRTDAPGITDEEVLARGLEDARVLLTFDKDFGELAWRSGLPANCSIVLFRLPALGPAGVGKIIADVLISRDDWPGHFFCRRAWPDSGARAPATADAIVNPVRSRFSCKSKYKTIDRRVR
jgi:predicted nuclease of predicted toxin-antitoxin system